MCGDRTYEQALAELSVPAAAHDPGGLTRRRFLHALAATGAATAAAPLLGTATAAAATLSAATSTEPVLVVVTLGGGNDGLNTVIPTSQSAYFARRGSLAIPNSASLPLTADAALHPTLTGLKARYDAGTVAIVQGVGNPAGELSHFSSMEAVMAGTSGRPDGTGWLGGWLDGVPGSADGLRAVAAGASIPLHLLGRTTRVTAISSTDLWGADRTEAWERACIETVEGFATGADTGVGPWGPALARTGRAALQTAATIAPSLAGTLPDEALAKQLVVAARLINADLGVRVMHTTLSGWDTHDGQAWMQEHLLGQLDAGIEALFTTLTDVHRGRVAVLVLSEFGRRVERNSSGGTDHGTSNVMLLVGDRVRSGLHGLMPSLTALDSRGNLRVEVDFRQVYASVLGQFLAGDPTAVLGSAYPGLDLFD